MSKRYTAEELHPVAADGRRLEGQEFDGTDVLVWINALNTGTVHWERVPAYIQAAIPADALDVIASPARR